MVIFWVSDTVHSGTDISEVKCTVTSESSEMPLSDFRSTYEEKEKRHI